MPFIFVLVFTVLMAVPQQAAGQQNIATTLGPGVGGIAGIKQGSELLAHTVNTTTDGFPDALCNDETPAVFFFRPHVGAANANRWLIMLMGGGSCGDPESCSRRWKRQDPLMGGFGANSMSTANLPTATNGNGLLERAPENPIGNWNQVLVHYCSSDRWSGTSRGVVPAYFPPHPLNSTEYNPEDPWVTRTLPVVGTVRMRLPFLGRAIFDAVLDTLRRDSPDGTLRYGGVPVRTPRFVDLPDLDDAEAVVLAGGSAGGYGVINNLDHLATYLRQNNTQCLAGNCQLEVAGISDSAFPPLWQGLDLTHSLPCLTLNKCTYDDQMTYSAAQGTARMWDVRGDASCVTWHLANDPTHAPRCADEGFVLTNHVTTPFFVRMGQTDELLLAVYQRLDMRPPSGQPMTSTDFAQLVRDQTRIAALGNIKNSANEGASILTTPGAFVPSCQEHDTLRQSSQVFGVEIGVVGPRGRTRAVTLPTLLRAWANGAEPAILVDPGQSTCP